MSVYDHVWEELYHDWLAERDMVRDPPSPDEYLEAPDVRTPAECERTATVTAAGS